MVGQPNSTSLFHLPFAYDKRASSLLLGLSFDSLLDMLHLTQFPVSTPLLLPGLSKLYDAFDLRFCWASPPLANSKGIVC